jgi:hypothetical protein
LARLPNKVMTLVKFTLKPRTQYQRPDRKECLSPTATFPPYVAKKIRKFIFHLLWICAELYDLILWQITLVAGIYNSERNPNNAVQFALHTPLDALSLKLMRICAEDCVNHGCGSNRCRLSVGISERAAADT